MGYSNIFIAVDGSKYSENAVKKGIELAEQLSANVIIASIVDVSQLVTNSSLGGVIDDEVLKIYKDEAEGIVNGLAKKNPYGKITTLTGDGIPQDDILKLARSHKADLIIMGTHGRTGLRHLFMGSVAEYVVRHSKIPVMVVPANAKI
jgi:nucleotide-binding universal stress UspA family protein